MYPKTFITALLLAPSAMGLALPNWMGNNAPAGLEARDVAFRSEAARLSQRQPVAAPAPHVIEIPQVEARNATRRDLGNITVSASTMSKRSNVTVLDRHLHRPTEFRG